MNKKITGKVVFKETKRGLQIKINMSGISPGLHGFHIHQYGDLSEGCGSLCSHFNPTNSVHGGRDSPERHLGDLGNIIADKSGNVDMVIYDKFLTITGKYGILGRSVVVHADEDDLGLGGLDEFGNVVDEKVRDESLKTGNAGKRIACGVIGYKKD
jgi:Cu-Zn family superoxide dismutase